VTEGNPQAPAIALPATPEEELAAQLEMAVAETALAIAACLLEAVPQKVEVHSAEAQEA
jgi:hypothetical protein